MTTSFVTSLPCPHPKRSRLHRECAVQGTTAHTQPRICKVYDWHNAQVPYELALSAQKQFLAEVQDQIGSDQPVQECAIICQYDHQTYCLRQHGLDIDKVQQVASAEHILADMQHPPVFTLGTASTLDNLKFPEHDSPFPLYRTERGGEVTYHGPGQLVLYPILDLRNHTQDLHWYLRALEEVVIRALANVSGIQATRVEGLTGVWVDGAKIAATGIRVSRWVTYHGIALNVCPDLLHFSYIVPCGIEDKPVTSVVQLLGGDVAVMGEQFRHESATDQKRSLVESGERSAIVQQTRVLNGATGMLHDTGHAGGCDELLDVYTAGMLEAFSEVFDLTLATTHDTPGMLLKLH